MSSKFEVIQKQLQWARRVGHKIDERSYLSNIDANLWQPLSIAALRGFNQGSGSELKDSTDRPAKIKALHSSAALAVNVFDYWTERDATALLEALGVGGTALNIEFEKQFPTGLGGNPPNLDVAITLDSGVTLAIESKFTEWLTPKPAKKEFFRPAYFPPGEGPWARLGLNHCQALVHDIHVDAEGYKYLDAPQLLKHALGLTTGLQSRFTLYYLYCDLACTEAEIHQLEIERFAKRVGAEIRFESMTYQRLLQRLAEVSLPADAGYIAYLSQRYLA